MTNELLKEYYNQSFVSSESYIESDHLRKENILFMHSDGYRDYRGNGDFQHYDYGTTGGGGSSGGGGGDGSCCGTAFGILICCGVPILMVLNADAVGDMLLSLTQSIAEGLCDCCCG